VRAAAGRGLPALPFFPPSRTHDPCFVSSLDNLRLHANLSDVRARTQRCGRQQVHRRMRRNGGLGRSAAAVCGVQPMLRRPQDGTRIERTFSRKKAQNAQQGNAFFETFEPLCGNQKSAIRNMSHRLTQIATDEDAALPHLCSSVSICGKSAIRPPSQGLRRAGNPQCRRTHDTLPKLLYLIIPARKSGFTRLDCGWTGPFCRKSSQPPLHEHLTHKWRPFQ
jgi:hypothetical protein